VKNDEMSLVSIVSTSTGYTKLGNQFIFLYIIDMTHSSESSSTQTVAIVGGGLVCNQFKYVSYTKQSKFIL
jgi:hypothetical protein